MTHDPDLVMLQLGVNDLWGGLAEVGRAGITGGSAFATRRGGASAGPRTCHPEGPRLGNRSLRPRL